MGLNNLTIYVNLFHSKAKPGRKWGVDHPDTIDTNMTDTQFSMNEIAMISMNSAPVDHGMEKITEE
jgi:hypothetical protein